MITSIEQALEYLKQEREGIFRDAPSHHNLGAEHFVWLTNERSDAGDQLLIEAVNEHAAQKEEAQ